MRKLFAVAVVATVVLVGCAGKAKWDGPLGLQEGLTIEDVESSIQLDNYFKVYEGDDGRLESFTSQTVLEDGAQASRYDYWFVNGILEKISATYEGEDNINKAGEYLHTIAQCDSEEETSIDSRSYDCYKKNAVEHTINDIIASAVVDKNVITKKEYLNIVYRYTPVDLN